MNNKQFSYQKEIGNTVYTVIVKESNTAKETIWKKLERAMIRDSLEECHSKGEIL